MEGRERLVRIAARATARVVARAQMVTERFAEEQMALTKAEADKHMSDYGHLYDEDCQAEFCRKARAMHAAAQAAVMGGA